MAVQQDIVNEQWPMTPGSPQSYNRTKREQLHSIMLPQVTTKKKSLRPFLAQVFTLLDDLLFIWQPWESRYSTPRYSHVCMETEPKSASTTINPGTTQQKVELSRLFTGVITVQCCASLFTIIVTVYHMIKRICCKDMTFHAVIITALCLLSATVHLFLQLPSFRTRNWLCLHLHLHII